MSDPTTPSNSIPTKRCPSCQRDLPMTAEFFYHDPHIICGLMGRCKECKKPSLRTASRNTYHARKQAGICVQCGENPPDVGLTLCSKCRPDAAGRRSRRYYRNIAERKCTKCGGALGNRRTVTCETCAGKSDKRNSAYYRGVTRPRQMALRQEVLTGYGEVCACCGEQDERFLSVDHVNGGGAAERKKSNPAKFYQRIIDEGFPDDYQVLCFNCNIAKYFYRVCPHRANLDSTPTLLPL